MSVGTAGVHVSGNSPEISLYIRAEKNNSISLLDRGTHRCFSLDTTSVDFMKISKSDGWYGLIRK
jgi:hypothetical protein